MDMGRMLELNGAWLKLAEFTLYAKNRTLNVAKNQVKIRSLKKEILGSIDLYSAQTVAVGKYRFQRIHKRGKISLKHLILIRF